MPGKETIVYPFPPMEPAQKKEKKKGPGLVHKEKSIDLLLRTQGLPSGKKKRRGTSL